MRLPVIQGVIRRRILVNFRVDPAVMQGQLPPRFRPKLHEGHALAGICLIRLESVRPRFVPHLLGFSSENAAHRVAVRWQADRGEKERCRHSPPGHGLGDEPAHRRSAVSRRHHRARFTVREPLQVAEVHSSYFSDEARLPRGSVEFDCALVMRHLGHEWHSVEDLYV